MRDRSTLRLVITRSVALRNTLINKGAERTRLIMDIHTGAQTKNEKRVWPLLAAAGMLHARWSGTLATTAAVRVLVESEVVVEVVVARVVSIGNATATTPLQRHRQTRQPPARAGAALAATAAVRVLVVVVVAVRVVAASTVGRVSLRVVFLLLHEQRARSKVGAGGVAPSPPPPPPPAPPTARMRPRLRAAGELSVGRLERAAPAPDTASVSCDSWASIAGVSAGAASATGDAGGGEAAGDEAAAA